MRSWSAAFRDWAEEQSAREAAEARAAARRAWLEKTYGRNADAWVYTKADGPRVLRWRG